MDEFEPGKTKLTELVRSLDPAVQCVIPTRSADGSFKVGLGKGNLKKFLSLSEDDLLDLVEDPAAEGKLRKTVAALVKELNP